MEDLEQPKPNPHQTGLQDPCCDPTRVENALGHLLLSAAVAGAR